MSNIGESSQIRPEYQAGNSDREIPLTNLSAVQTRIESLQIFLSESVNSNTLITKQQMDLVSSEITAAIHQIIVNGAALLVCSQPTPPPLPPSDPEIVLDSAKRRKISGDSELDCEIVEIDAVELLAEHTHFCDICGKGFKRDANLRMHMRAHGNEFKKSEFLAKPDKGDNPGRKTRFSCPFEGCNRNKKSAKFRALKSVICVKNHFKRTHCPKMFSCERCHKKSFSVVADLKSHYKHCGERKWKCSCGTGFSRKDKLFGHVALFEGHMPEVDERIKGGLVAMEEEGDDDEEEVIVNGAMDDGLFQGLLDGFDSIENYCLQDMLGLPS